MNHHHRLEEGLEILFTLQERGIGAASAFIEKCGEPEPRVLLDELERAGLVEIEDEQVTLTPRGRERATAIIRRHRLAEVMMRSVLDIEEGDMEQTACAFEHILGEEAVERVCSFLGHPSRCPHGHPIPPGPCCDLTAEFGENVLPLSEARVGDRCEVVYIRPKHHTRLDRLGAYGIVPRSVVRLHQKRPSFVVQIDETDLAIDVDVARDIYVRVRT